MKNTILTVMLFLFTTILGSPQTIKTTGTRFFTGIYSVGHNGSNDRIDSAIKTISPITEISSQEDIKNLNEKLLEEYQNQKRFGDTPLLPTFYRPLNDYDELDPTIKEDAVVVLVAVSDFNHNSNFPQLFKDEEVKQLAKKANSGSEEAKIALEKHFAQQFKKRKWNVLTVYGKTSKVNSNLRFMKEISADGIEYQLTDKEKISKAILQGIQKAPVIIIIWVLDHSESLQEFITPTAELVKETTKKIKEKIVENKLPTELDVKKFWIKLKKEPHEIGTKTGGRPDELYHIFNETRDDLYVCTHLLTKKLWNQYLEATGCTNLNLESELDDSDSVTDISYEEIQGFLAWANSLIDNFTFQIADQFLLEYVENLDLKNFSHGKPNRLRTLSSSWYGEYCSKADHMHNIECELKKGTMLVVKGYSALYDDSPEIMRPQYRGGIPPSGKSEIVGCRLIALER